ncbi:hypothetical protein COCON_G00220440 [Conger conger]|uniref:PH domain-containing protein n=1 Tax=Conger conger TaxID=82655 RepID=A0A9Q1CYF3_CONCO|nr:hypothetical protein COCON_G00220440 [Conger conger]
MPCGGLYIAATFVLARPPPRGCFEGARQTRYQRGGIGCYRAALSQPSFHGDLPLSRSTGVSQLAHSAGIQNLALIMRYLPKTWTSTSRNSRALRCRSRSRSRSPAPSLGSESSTVETSTGSKGSKGSGKVHGFGKRDQAIKRNLNVPVVVRGWLYKQDSSGMRLWKRKWFVLSEYCLFYYKDSREEAVLGSIPLPSYVTAPVEPDDHINRKFAFKSWEQNPCTWERSLLDLRSSHVMSCGDASAHEQPELSDWLGEQGVMRTYYFSADTQEDMSVWVRCMSQAAMLQEAPHRESVTSERSMEEESSERQAVPQTNHVNSSSPSPSQTEAPPLVLGEEPGVEPGEGTPPQTPPPSHAPQRNGLPPPEQNGMSRRERGGAPPETERQAQRKTTLAQVERWVKGQKGGDSRSLPTPTSPSDPLPGGPRPQPKPGRAEAYRSLPRTPCAPPGSAPLPGEYQYAADRLSHLRMSVGERVASRQGAVWQLYEWQQRQRYRHGSPTAPAAPPPRPHTPPAASPSAPDHTALEVPRPVSPRRLRSQMSKTSLVERRSMPPIGYITHTVSAPSLHGKTPEELTLLLIQLRMHQARMGSVRNNALTPLLQHNSPCGPPRLQADDTYMQMKKDLEYLDLKVQVTGRDALRDRPTEPLKIAESDVDVKLSRLCEQDKILQDLESRIRTLKEDKDKLESVLDVLHQQMDQYRAQPAHADKIACQQRLLQEDLVHIRADISRVSTEMEGAWDEYSRLERDLVHLREALQDQLSQSVLSQQEKTQVRRELWRIEDVMAGLSSSKSHFQVSINSVKNPERRLVPSVSMSSVPSLALSASVGEIRPTPRTPVPPSPDTLPPAAGPGLPRAPPLARATVGPRMLPQLYSPEDPMLMVLTMLQHASRETGLNGEPRVELRACLSEPELWPPPGPPGPDRVQTLPHRGLTSSTSQLNEGVSSNVTLRRTAPASGLKQRPQSAVEQLSSGGECVDPRGWRMSAEEQLQRMKRQQRAALRERKRALSQGERGPAPGPASRSLSADLASWRREQAFDLQLLERAVPGEERWAERAEHPRSQSDEWLTVQATPIQTEAMEPLDYDLDLSRELSVPEKVLIPERYVDEPSPPPTQEELEARQRKAQQIRSVLARSSVQNVDGVYISELDSAVQEKERIISISHTLASEASQLSRAVAAKAQCQNPEELPTLQ